MPKIPTLVDEPKISQNGLDVSLNCQAEADPAPQAIWSKDEKEILANDDYQLSLIAATGALYKACCIIKVGLRHGRKCSFCVKRFSELFKTTSWGVQVRIQERPGPICRQFYRDGRRYPWLWLFFKCSLECSLKDAPEFVEKPHIIQVDKGKALRIKVKVKSKTKPTVGWSKLEQAVQENDRVSSSSNEEADGCVVYVLEIKVTNFISLCKCKFEVFTFLVNYLSKHLSFRNM